MNPNTSIYSFSIVFEGEATANHSMSVRSWAISLLGWNDLVRATTQTLSPISTIDLRVTTARRGSIGIDLDLVSEHAPSIIRTILGIIRITRARNLNHEEPIAAESNAAEHEHLYVKTTAIGDTSTTEIEAKLTPDNMRELINAPNIQKALTKSIEPLRQSGVEKIHIQDTHKRVLETITKEDLELLAPAPERREYISHERQLVLISPILDNSANKWRLKDGNRRRAFSVKDHDFLLAVDDGELSFASGDTLICDVRYKETIYGNRIIKTEGEIIKVHDIRPSNFGELI